ncbi:MAG: hydroxymyristoyl-ACP dehydratase [Salinivirgaceae bacterium]|nr:hydroxymyristoyl-ACP dehydratase [Salinivirgaceae bacterium]
MKQALFQGDDIAKLIPQRPPIVMVSHFFGATETEAETGLEISAGNIFCKNNKLTEPGLIEHIAQSAAAFAGFNAIGAGQKVVLGYIGEIKKLTINSLPQVGKMIETRIGIVSEVMNVLLMSARSTVDGQTVAECSIKLFMDSGE